MSAGPASALHKLEAGAPQIARSAVVLGTARFGGDLSIPPPTAIAVEPTQETIPMGQLHAYRGIVPTIAPSATLFPAEIRGDVVGRISGPLQLPTWAWRRGALPVLAPTKPSREET
jgi:hypothetical protein